MEYPPPGHHKSVAAFRAQFRALDEAFDCDEVLEGASGPLGAELALGPKTLRNRFAIHPMEGWDGTRDGMPTEPLRRRWHRFGASGADLIWGGEAMAVQEDGRANPRQLFANPNADTPGALAELFAEIQAGRAEIGGTPADLLTGLQLTHSGRFSRPDGEPAPRIAYHHPLLDAKFAVDPALAPLTDGELEGIAARFVQLARMVWNTGFDFVDVKCAHGYLLHELLSARSRPGKYGGSFENRTRLFAEIVRAIQAECPGLDVGVRISIADVFPHVANPETRTGEPRGWEQHVPYEYGFGLDPADPCHFDLGEPFRFLELVSGLGIRLVNLSLGSPYYCPHLQRPAAYPPSDGYLPPRDPLADVLEHLHVTRQCKAAFPGLVFVGTGYSYLQEYLPHVAQHEVRHGHVDFVGLGRTALVYFDLPRDVLAGRPLDRKKICRTFSDCTTGPRNGLISGCYPLDPYYKRLPEALELKALKRTLRS